MAVCGVEGRFQASCVSLRGILRRCDSAGGKLHLLLNTKYFKFTREGYSVI